MVNERRPSSDSEQSSSSRSYSTESTKTECVVSSNRRYRKNSARWSNSNIFSDETMRMKLEKIHSSHQYSILPSASEMFSARMKTNFIDLNPFFQCSTLPSHWRKNKSLRFIIRAKNPIEIKSNTRVIVFAGNDHNPSAQLKNNVGWFHSGQVEFNDLRFLSVSGRGKKFTLNIIIETVPPQQCTYRHAIKITVDGPRKKRHSKPKSDVNETQTGDSPSDEHFDDETRMTSTSIISDTKPTLNQGSSGLFLLAAVAEQKWKDEQDKSTSMDMNYSLNCLSPSSSLASHFSQSIKFSPMDDFSSVIRLKSSHFGFYSTPTERCQSETMT